MSSTRLLRYTGELPKSFTENGVGEVETGAEFEVPEDQAERYLRRSDVEDATPKTPRKPKAAAGASDDANASQDGETNGASLPGDCEDSGSPTGNSGGGEQQVP